MGHSVPKRAWPPACAGCAELEICMHGPIAEGHCSGPQNTVATLYHAVVAIPYLCVAQQVVG